MAEEERNGMSHVHLTAARKAKNDEFYTRIEDVAEELRHYKKHFLRSSRRNITSLLTHVFGMNRHFGTILAKKH